MLEKARFIGEHLREARQQRGEDLYDIADYLRIRPAYLFALEEGDLDATPGRPYALGFLRSYASYLGFDGEATVAELKAPAAQPEGAALNYRQPIPDRRLPSGPVVAVSILLAALAYGGWYASQQSELPLVESLRVMPGEIGRYAAGFFSEDDEDAPAAISTAGKEESRPRQAAPIVRILPETGRAVLTEPSGVTPVSTPVIEQLESPEPSISSSALDTDGGLGIAPATGPVVRTSNSTAGEDGIDARADELGGERRGIDASLLVSSATAGGDATPAAEEERTAGDLLASLQAGDDQPAETRVFGGEAGQGRVVLVARESSWVQIQSAGRDYVRTRTLQPGDRFVLPDRDDLALWTGNAGGIEVTLDGRSLGVLGARGSVIRDISLAPEALVARQN